MANKDDLDGMIDVVFSEIDLPASDAGWRTAMRQRAASVREALAPPWATGLMELRTTHGPTSLRHHEAVLDCLREAGFDRERHPRVLAPGQLPLRVRDPGGEPAVRHTEELVEMAEINLPRVPAETYPRLNEAAAALAAGYDYTRVRVRSRPILDGLGATPRSRSRIGRDRSPRSEATG